MRRLPPRRRDTPPTLDDLRRIADQQLTELPALFRRHVRSVVIRVEELCDPDTEREMRLESPFELMGLYSGTPVGDKSLAGPVTDLDMIFLYRRAILDYWCETGEDLSSIVRHVLIHEIGHHFGLSDEDMQRIEDEE